MKDNLQYLNDFKTEMTPYNCLVFGCYHASKTNSVSSLHKAVCNVLTFLATVQSYSDDKVYDLDKLKVVRLVLNENALKQAVSRAVDMVQVRQLEWVAVIYHDKDNPNIVRCVAYNKQWTCSADIGAPEGYTSIAVQIREGFGKYSAALRHPAVKVISETSLANDWRCASYTIRNSKCYRVLICYEDGAGQRELPISSNTAKEKTIKAVETLESAGSFRQAETTSSFGGSDKSVEGRRNQILDTVDPVIGCEPGIEANSSNLMKNL